MRGPSQKELAELLREVLPYAHQEAASIAEVARKDGDEVASDDAAAAEELLDTADAALANFDEANRDLSDHLKGLPLHEALWWFIENVSDEDIHKQTYFFILRERMHQHNTEGDAFDMIGRHVARESRLAANKMTADTWYDLSFKMKYAPVAQISNVQLIKAE